MASTIEAPTTRVSARVGSPLVSICIPSYNGAPWIVEAIESALAQDYQRHEIIVCDDASSDETVAMAREFGDPRLRVLANQVRVGMARNWNRCVRASNGDYVKLLMQDDRLASTCVRRMLDVMDAHPDVGLVFSPREVQLDDPNDPESSLWKERFGVLHASFGPLSLVNDGRAMFDRLRDGQFRHNGIGEPTVVMVRRRALIRVGLFNVRLRQLTDLELWLRIAFFHDIGFVPDALATFRVHRRSVTAANERTGAGWLDRVWLLEGLRAHPEIRAALGSTTEALIWFDILRSTGKRLIGKRAGTMPSQTADLRNYLRFRLGRDRRPLHEVLMADRNGEARLGATRAGSGADTGAHDDP
ncbi:MAG TPA: glycosyltransferase [Candidatus Limnocylindrales bacterium]